MYIRAVCQTILHNYLCCERILEVAKAGQRRLNMVKIISSGWNGTAARSLREGFARRFGKKFFACKKFFQTPYCDAYTRLAGAFVSLFLYNILIHKRAAVAEKAPSEAAGFKVV